MTTRLGLGYARTNWTAIARYLKEEGHDPDAFPTMAYHNVNLHPDRQAALEESKRFLDAYYGPCSRRRWWRRGPQRALRLGMLATS